MGYLLKTFDKLDEAMNAPKTEGDRLKRDYVALVETMRAMGVQHGDMYRGLVGASQHEELMRAKPYAELSDAAKRLLPEAVDRANKKIAFLRAGGDVKDFRIKARRGQAKTIPLDDALKAVYDGLKSEVLRTLTARIKTGNNDDGQEPLLNLFRVLLAYKPELDEEGPGNA